MTAPFFVPDFWQKQLTEKAACPIIKKYDDERNRLRQCPGGSWFLQIREVM